MNNEEKFKAIEVIADLFRSTCDGNSRTSETVMRERSVWAEEATKIIKSLQETT